MGLCRSEASLVYRFPGQSGLHRAIPVFKKTKQNNLRASFLLGICPSTFTKFARADFSSEARVTGAHGAGRWDASAPGPALPHRRRSAVPRDPESDAFSHPSDARFPRPGKTTGFRRGVPSSAALGIAGTAVNSGRSPSSQPRGPGAACQAPTGRESGRPRLPSAGRPGSPERTRPTPSPFPGDPHPPPASAESTSSSAAIAFITAAAQAQERTSKPADRPTGRPPAAAALKTAPPAHASSARWDAPRARPRHHRLGVPAAQRRRDACAALSRGGGGTG